MQWTILFDRDKCVGCDSCVIACKLEHNLPPYAVHPPFGDPTGPELIRIHQVGLEIRDDEVRQYFQPISCLHCLDATCIGACPRSAVYKDIETGITLINDHECIGCKSCVSVCPYGAPQFYDGKVYLCDLCIHRLREGRHAACEAACPARAIHVGTREETSDMVGRKAAK